MSFFVFILMIFFYSCAGTNKNTDISPRDKFNEGIKNLENEKYLQAQLDFKNVIIRGTGTELGDDAQYFLGEAYFKNEEYLLAIAEYEKLTRKMGFSPFVEDARFKICEAYSIESPKYYHDQEYTRKALDRYQEFLDDYPNSKLLDDVLASIRILREKLARKYFENGKLYLKIKKFKSAMYYFDIVISDYYDTKYSDKAKISYIFAYILMKDYDSAVGYFNKNKTSFRSPNSLKEAEEILNEYKNGIGISGYYRLYK